MKNTSKKGFTVVELVIVIAVIAVLAAVLIPTFSSLIKKANESVDVQVVAQMNKVLAAEEAISGKPATVVDAKAILVENRCDDFTPAEALHVFYWIGSENRVIIWKMDEAAAADADATPTGKVTYPKELAKKYKDVTTVSVDWSDLSANYDQQMIAPEEGQTIEEAMLAAIAAADTDEDAYLILPKNSVLNFTAAQNRQLSDALKSAAGVGKHVSIDMNGSTINIVDTYGVDIPDNGALELANGTFNHTNAAYDDSTFQVGAGSSLVLRDMNLNLVGHTGIAPLDDASEVIIDGCEINSDANFGLMTNGMTSRVVHIVINDSTINNTVDGGGVGMCVNCTANIHIENSTIIGANHALVLRAGHAEVKNSVLQTVSASNTFKYDSFTHFSEKPRTNGADIDGAPATYVWSHGNRFPGGALVIGDYARETESYPGDVVVDLVNVTCKSIDTDIIPLCLVAAKLTKNVTLTYDGTTNITDVKLYNYMIPQYFGSITVNGVAKTLN